MWKVRGVAVAITIIMAIVIYVYNSEIIEYHDETVRLEQDGPEFFLDSYASNMSLMTSSIQFVLNFMLFMIYF
jgi:hypothetical protein